jgi:phenylacetate-CoA ligase
MKPLIRNILLPFHEYLKGHMTLKMLKDLERTQWLTTEELRQLQRQKYKAIVAFVQENVPFYRDLLASQSDGVQFPYLRKNDIRNNFKRMCSEKANGLVRSNTGGSTGEPLIFYLGKRRISADVAAKIRATKWWGVDIGDKEVVIWGSPVEFTKQDRIRTFRDWLFRTRLLSAFDMTEETMFEYLNFMREFKPLHVFGYPSSIHVLCKYARKKNIRLDDIGVKVVFCTAERLYDDQREFISEVFSAPVANGYGGRDSGFIAHECPEGRMHITDENIMVEIVVSTGNILQPGETGEIVITHLESHDFPFIRYKTGDIGALSDETCPCGRGLSVLKAIEGRGTDFIVTPKGKIMHGLSLIYVVRDTEGIEEFKIVQEDYDKINLFLSVNEKFSEKHALGIKKGFSKRLGADVNITIHYVDKISHEKSGKYRYVESHVQQPYAQIHR